MRSVNAINPFSQRGFTLLEVLIAITITALIGIGASQILSSAIRTNEQTQQRLQELQSLQKAMLLIARDFQQLISRSIRDGFGDYQPALISGNEDYLLEFSRTGWRNPLADPRSDLQRVAYSLRDGTLIRHYWDVLDRGQDSEAVEWVMLSDVEEFSVKYMNSSGGWTDDWPPEQNDSSASDDPMYKYNQIPKGLSFRLVHPLFGEITRVFDLPVYLAHTAIVSAGQNTNNGDSDQNALDNTGGTDGAQDGGNAANNNNDEVSQ